MAGQGLRAVHGLRDAGQARKDRRGLRLAGEHDARAALCQRGDVTAELERVAEAVAADHQQRAAAQLDAAIPLALRSGEARGERACGGPLRPALPVAPGGEQHRAERAAVEHVAWLATRGLALQDDRLVGAQQVEQGAGEQADRRRQARVHEQGGAQVSFCLVGAAGAQQVAAEHQVHPGDVAQTHQGL